MGREICTQATDSHVKSHPETPWETLSGRFLTKYLGTCGSAKFTHKINRHPDPRTKHHTALMCSRNTADSTVGPRGRRRRLREVAFEQGSEPGAGFFLVRSLDLGPVLLQHDLLLMNSICKGLISRESHILRFQGDVSSCGGTVFSPVQPGVGYMEENRS